MIRTFQRRAALTVWLSLAAAGCAGDAQQGAGSDAAVDSLPLSVPATQVLDGLLIATPEQVRDWQETGEDFALVDARDTVQFAREHIPGAINVPYIEIRAGALLPPKDRRIVVYCSSETCPISQYAYEALDRLGYEQVYDMRAGLQGWKDAGFPTVFGADSAPPSR